VGFTLVFISISTLFIVSSAIILLLL
jgi:hypothetical protein